MLSHPAWVRGLKQSEVRLIMKYLGSHPAWVRGLKPDWKIQLKK